MSYGCFVAAIILALLSWKAGPKENFFIPGAIQLLSHTASESAEMRHDVELHVENNQPVTMLSVPIAGKGRYGS